MADSIAQKIGGKCLDARITACESAAVKRGLARLVRYQGMLPQSAHRVNEILYHLVARYGVAYDSIHAMSQADYTDIFPGAAHSPAATYLNGSVRTLILNNHFFQDPALFNKWRDQNLLVLDPSLRGVLTHEYGHLLQDEFRWPAEQFYPVYITSGGGLSDYADENADEMLAEAFVRHESGGWLPTSLLGLHGLFSKAESVRTFAESLTDSASDSAAHEMPPLLTDDDEELLDQAWRAQVWQSHLAVGDWDESRIVRSADGKFGHGGGGDSQVGTGVTWAEPGKCVVREDVRAAYAKLLGHEATNKVIAGMAGTEPGAAISTGISNNLDGIPEHLQGKARPPILSVGSRNESYRSVRLFWQDADGNKQCYNHIIHLSDKTPQGGGLGTRVFARQVANLSTLGFSAIHAELVSAPPEEGVANKFCGAYTWARLGYDGSLKSDYQKMVPEQHQKSTTLHSLLSTEDGTKAWRQANENSAITIRDGCFDLSSGSTSRRVLDSYLQGREKAGRPVLFACFAGDWDESKHTRGEDGRFGGAGTGSPTTTLAGPFDHETEEQTRVRERQEVKDFDPCRDYGDSLVRPSASVYPHAVPEALRKRAEAWEDYIAPISRDALKAYVRDDFKPLNSALAAVGGDVYKLPEDHVSGRMNLRDMGIAMMSALWAHGPNDPPLTVWRAMRLSPEKMESFVKAAEIGIKTGEPLHMPVFGSATLNPEKVVEMSAEEPKHQYAPNKTPHPKILLEIKSRSGMYVGGTSMPMWTGENEVIQPPTAKYKVVGFADVHFGKDKRRILKLEELPPDPEHYAGGPHDPKGRGNADFADGWKADDHPRDEGGKFAPSQSDASAKVEEQEKNPLYRQHGPKEARDSGLDPSLPKDVQKKVDAWLAGISDDQKDAINYYTSGEYGKLNTPLRKSPDLQGVDPDVTRRVSLIQSALLTAPVLDKPLNSWRGLDCDNNDVQQAIEDGLLAAMKSGEPLKMPGFNSASISTTLAASWSPGGVVLEIRSRRASYIDSVSDSKGEREVLHPHNATYRVVSVHEAVPIVHNPSANHATPYPRRVYVLEEVGEPAKFTADAEFDWDESRHPRAEGGRFGSGDSSTSPTSSAGGDGKVAAIHRELNSLYDQQRAIQSRLDGMNKVMILTFPDGSRLEHAKAADINPSQWPAGQKPKITNEYRGEGAEKLQTDIKGVMEKINELSPQAKTLREEEHRDWLAGRSPEHLGVLQNMHSDFDSSLERFGESLSAQQVSDYRQAAHKSFDNMTQTAMERYSSNVHRAFFYASTEQLGKDLSWDVGIKKAVDAGERIGGAYDPSTKELHLDGSMPKSGLAPGHSISHIYSHEFSHGIDGPEREISDSPQWQEAWKEEIQAKGSPSNYATTSSSEGFAEFGRLVLQGGSPQQLAVFYPKCAAVWRAHGIMPGSGS